MLKVLIYAYGQVARFWLAVFAGFSSAIFQSLQVQVQQA
jgi:hypothetical protein